MVYINVIFCSVFVLFILLWKIVRYDIFYNVGVKRIVKLYMYFWLLENFFESR